MDNKFSKTLLTSIKFIWVVIALLVLSISLYAYDGKSYSDIWIFLTWSMLILSFPAGLLVSMTHFLLGQFFSLTVMTSYVSLTLEWAVYFSLGYLQWFILLPYLFKKIRNAKG